MRKVKIFAGDMYGDEGCIYRMQEELQKGIDDWLNANPSFLIESTSISLNKHGAILSVLYREDAPFGTIK